MTITTDVVLARAPQRFAALVRVATANRRGTRPNIWEASGAGLGPPNRVSNRYKQVRGLIDDGLLIDSGTPNRSALTITTAGLAALRALGVYPTGTPMHASEPLPAALLDVAKQLADAGDLTLAFQLSRR